MKFTFTAALLATAFTVACAQENERWMPFHNRIGLALGIGSMNYLDKNASPLIYTSKPKNVRLFYNLETSNFLFSVDVDFKIGNTTAKYHPGRTLLFYEQDYKGKNEEKKFPATGSLMGARMSLGAFYKLGNATASKTRVAVGAKLMNELFYPQGWTTSGLFNALSFSPEVLVQQKFDEKHSLIAHARLPLVTRLTRLNYNNTVSAPSSTQLQSFFRNSNWVSTKRFVSPAIGIDYNYNMNNKWGAGLNYEFTWYSITTAQPMKAVTQSLLANIYRQF
jgi:hypothetical protein